MGYAATHSATLIGLSGQLLNVEADTTPGSPGLEIVGFPEGSAAWTRARVRAAVINSGLAWPDQQITISVLPGSVPKYVAMLDLAIAVALVAADGQIPEGGPAEVLFIGELGLDGRIRPVRGVLPAVGAAAGAGITTVVVPDGNAAEAAQAPGVTVIPATTLAHVVAWLRDGSLRGHAYHQQSRPTSMQPPALDMADVAGNETARRALEVCAAGGHHLFLLGDGPATMLAERLPGILPSLNADAAREVAEIYSLAGGLDSQPATVPPLYAPHHTITMAAMLGGGNGPVLVRPGAISLAHHGVLYMDEAPEFSGQILDELRRPLETGQVILARGNRLITLPARFMLVMSARSCPCPSAERCQCPPLRRRRYLHRLTGLLDRVEVRARLQPAPRLRTSGESSATVAARVREARERTAARLAGTPWTTNSQVPALELHTTYRAQSTAIDVLRSALNSGMLTAASFTRVLRVAWTLADLRGADRPARKDATTALELWTAGAHC
ncbi:YifB family Mg chelatase-like AAA ATPase [Microbispora sp. NPDC049125]|uniref:YifB family Mg chelatase-like AAA ATPase n=1 Tax=Microbispora sp. NPDC049125 TaxID=3154929 RepID=UPI0034677958